MRKLLLIVLLAGFVISSCTVERRVHQKGFNVEWNKHLSNNKKDKNQALDIESGEEIAEKPIKIKANLNAENTIVNITNSDGIDATENQDLTADNQNLAVSSATKITTLNIIRNKNKSAVKLSAYEISGDVKNAMKKNKKTFKKSLVLKKVARGDVPIGLLYVLCFIIPFVAVGLATDWDFSKVIIAFLLSFLIIIPGIIYALIIVGRNSY